MPMVWPEGFPGAGQREPRFLLRREASHHTLRDTQPLYPMTFLHRLERVFFWLSGAATDSLEACPAWERRKYVAFGATVLVPSLFAMMSAAYAISTLTDNWYVIAPVSLIWSFIILTVDRALLATYRAYQSVGRKLAQFSLRIVVAALMGMTISHPLALLLFRDTVTSVIEEDRQKEIEAARATALAEKKSVENKVVTLETEIAAQRAKWNETFSASFLEKIANGGGVPLSDDEAKAKAELDKRVAEATKPVIARIETVEKDLETNNIAAKKITEELNHWQTEFERELNGQRSGIIGLGPRAKSIQDDQLIWRRAESKRLTSVLETLTAQRGALKIELKAAETGVTTAFNEKLAENAAKVKEEAARIEALRRQVQQQQADQFVVQQNAIRTTLAQQIDTLLLQLKRLHEEIAKITEDEQARITALRAEPRKDILTQTLALHRLFKAGAEGGQFAFAAYVILTLLFMLVDTIPLVVKFFSKPGPYDTLLDCDEVRFDRERQTFLSSFNRYMNELAGGKLLHLTQNKPLERALIEGVDRSRAAKEFLESLLEMEKAFEERIRIEREILAKDNLAERAAERVAMLEEMAKAFYADLRQRMEQFFNEGGSRRATSRA